jgi:hypothetical protein
MPSWKEILEQFAMILAAPIPFFVVTLAIFGIVWAAYNWAYSSIIANRDATIVSLEQRIKLRDDQLADKLHSTPPDEARSIIRGLEDRLKNISPRRLDPSNRAILAEKLKLPSGTSYRINILHDGACSDCNLFATDYSALFSSVGWSVTNITVIGPGRVPPSGLGIIISNQTSLSGAETLVTHAMQLAKIAFDLQVGPAQGADVGLLFTAKAE